MTEMINQFKENPTMVVERGRYITFLKQVMGCFFIYSLILLLYFTMHKYVGIGLLWFFWGILLFPDKDLPKWYHKLGWLFCYPILIPLIKVRYFSKGGDND